METMQWFLLSLWIGCLGLVSGYSFSSRRMAVGKGYVISILVLTFILSLFGTSIGRWLGESLPLRFFEVLLGLGMLVIGFLLLYLPPQYPGKRDLMLIGAVWAGSMLLQGFYVGMSDGRGITMALWSALLLTGGGLAGLLLSQFRLTNWRLHQLKPHVPGILLIFLGLIRLF